MPLFPINKDNNETYIQLRFGRTADYDKAASSGYILSPAELAVCYDDANKLEKIVAGGDGGSPKVVWPVNVEYRYLTDMEATDDVKEAVDLHFRVVSDHPQLYTDELYHVSVYAKYVVTARAPTFRDNYSGGYGIGSIWLDSTNNHVYVCTETNKTWATWVDLFNKTGLFMETVSKTKAIVRPNVPTKITSAATVELDLPKIGYRNEYTIMYAGSPSDLKFVQDVQWSTPLTVASSSSYVIIFILYSGGIYLGSYSVYA